MTSLPLQSHDRSRSHRLPQPSHPLHTGQAVAQALPNNLGPTLLLALGFPLVPLLIGVPFVLWGLAGIRDAQGELALPWLAHRLPLLIAWGKVFS